jgi:hypothetical protein
MTALHRRASCVHTCKTVELGKMWRKSEVEVLLLCM